MSDTTKVEVLLDIHEPQVLHEILQEHDDVESVKITSLDAADIVIGDVGFERKAWNDYANSMTDGRLTDQDKKMACYEHSYVLVDGDMADTETLRKGPPGKSIRGHMASFTAREEYGVDGVVPCSNTTLLADYAVRLARKHSEDPTRTELPTGVVGNDEPPGKQMWGCLPNVGPELADRLWQRFGTPTQFCDERTSSEEIEDLMDVEGIGEQTATQLIKELWRGAP